MVLFPLLSSKQYRYLQIYINYIHLYKAFISYYLNNLSIKVAARSTCLVTVCMCSSLASLAVLSAFSNPRFAMNRFPYNIHVQYNHSIKELNEINIILVPVRIYSVGYQCHGSRTDLEDS